MNYLIIWPVIFIVAFTLASTVVERVAGMIVGRFAAPIDSANARIVMNIVVCVLMMSATMSSVGRRIHRFSVGWPISEYCRTGC